MHDVIRQELDEIRQNDIPKKTPGTLEKQGVQANDEIRLTDNVIKIKPQQRIAICEYEPCGKEFVQTVSWKRHCSDNCRKLNWELVNGKKLNLKKRK